MDDLPETRYARTVDGVHVAHQVLGDGPIDLVWTSMWVSHLELEWQNSFNAAFNRRLARFSRLIRFDKRGTGLSDRVFGADAPTLEQRMDDLRAVLDSVGSERAAVFGASEGGPMSILFAATYPERVSSLVLYASFAKRTRSDDYPWGLSREEVESQVDRIEARWGEGMIVDRWGPGYMMGSEARQSDRWRSAMATFERNAASPASAAALRRMNLEIDIRGILRSVLAPTLVLHGEDDEQVDIGNSRYLADNIAGAKLVTLPGQPHWLWGPRQDAIADQIELFVTGSRAATPTERVLATVLFTDFVDSTPKAEALGDARWREVLARHDLMTRRTVEQWRGKFVKSTGDGIVATFDGPGRAIDCAKAVRDSSTELGVTVRSGLHTSEIELLDQDIAGIGVHIAARVCALAQPNEVLVSGAIPPLVTGSGITFEDRGDHPLKGVSGTWRLWAVTG